MAATNKDQIPQAVSQQTPLVKNVGSSQQLLHLGVGDAPPQTSQGGTDTVKTPSLPPAQPTSVNLPLQNVLLGTNPVPDTLPSNQAGATSSTQGLIGGNDSQTSNAASYPGSYTASFSQGSMTASGVPLAGTTAPGPSANLPFTSYTGNSVPAIQTDDAQLPSYNEAVETKKFDVVSVPAEATVYGEEQSSLLPEFPIPITDDPTRLHVISLDNPSNPLVHEQPPCGLPDPIHTNKYPMTAQGPVNISNPSHPGLLPCPSQAPSQDMDAITSRMGKSHMDDLTLSRTPKGTGEGYGLGLDLDDILREADGTTEELKVEGK